MLRLQAPLPDDYTLATDDELVARIAAAKAALGDRLLILGHHYQRDEVIRWADTIGDSFKLARFAADNDHADRHRVLRRPLHGRVGRRAHRRPPARDPPRPQRRLLDGRHGRHRPGRGGLGGDRRRSPTIDRVVPITYMNSSAALKAFVGRHGGAVCTSSNARAVLEWALDAGRQGALLPRPAPRPQHRLRDGLHRERHAGVEPAPRARRARGARGQGRDVPAVEGPLLGAPAVPARARRGRSAPSTPASRSIVHPECAHDVVELADRVGSTERIQEWVEAAPAGAVHRRSAPRSTWCSASPPSTPTRRSSRSTRSICPCSTMFRIDAPHLAWVLENLVAGDGREPDRRRRRHRRVGPGRARAHARDHLTRRRRTECVSRLERPRVRQPACSRRDAGCTISLDGEPSRGATI